MLEVIRASRRYALPATLLLFRISSAAYGQTTAFTYQGQLSDGGAVANGSFDLRFALFETGEGGTQIGALQTVPAVTVRGGVFTVQLDFGANAFPGANRFLEIGVKPAGSGSFTTLAPRQQISSSPYSIRTLSAATADALSSACVGCVQSTQINSVAGSKISGAIPATSVPTGSGNYIQNSTAQQANANFNIAGSGVVGGDLTVAGMLNANIGNSIRNQNSQQPNANFNISGNGTLGGTLFASKLEIAAQEGLRISGFQPLLTLLDTNSGGKRGIVSTGSGDLGFYVDTSIGGSPTVVIKNGTGNLGVGNAAPIHKLTVSGGPAWTSFSWGGAVALDNAAAIAWQHNASNQSFGIGQTTGGLSFFRTNSAPGTTGSPANYDLTIADSGNVGVGTTNPTSGRLQVDGGTAQSGVYATTGATNVPGVYGGSSGLNGTGVTGEANNGPLAYGVWGKSTSGYGVYGRTNSGSGVLGESDGAGPAVHGKSSSGCAVLAEGDLQVIGDALLSGKVRATAFLETSDRNAKMNFSNVEPGTILHRLASIPIQTWNFQSQPATVRHLGPMAQDFYAAFDLGEDDKHIATVDADGVALAAIQDLYQIVQEKDRQLQELQLRVQQLERRVQAQ